MSQTTLQTPLATDRSDSTRRQVSSRGVEVPKAGFTSRGIAILVMFLLAFDFPTVWFDTSTQLAGEQAPQGYVPAAIVLATVFGFLAMINNPDVVIRLISFEPLLPIFILMLAVSALWSAYPVNTLRFALPMILLVFVGYWMVAQFRLEELLLLVSIALAIGTFVNYALVFGLPQFGQTTGGWSGVYPLKNALGRTSAFAAMHFVLAAGTFRGYRWVWTAMAVLASVLVVGSESATSLSGLGFVLGIFVVSRVFRARKTLYGAITTAMLGGSVLAMFVATANLPYLTGILGKDVTLTGRTLLWEVSFDVGMEQPWLGYGWAGFWQGPLSPARPVIDVNTWNPPHAHNALLDYFLTVGAVGAAISVALFVRFLVRASRAVRFRPGTLGLWPITYGAFAVVFSLTEFGVISRSLFFLVFVILVTVSGLESRKQTGNRVGGSGHATEKAVNPT